MVSRFVVIALAAIAVAGTLAIAMSTQEQWTDIASNTTGAATLYVLSCPSAVIPPGGGAAASDVGIGQMPDVAAAAIFPGIATTNNCFAVNFYRQISNNSDNIFFSPISVYAAFSMVAEGAKGETASQLHDVFGFEPDRDLRHSAAAGLMSSLNRPDPDVTILMANSLWLAEWFEPYDSYADAVRDTYLSDIDNVDFLGDGVGRINNWVVEKTQGKIPGVLSPNAVNERTAFVLLNAIYFKGAWAVPFSEEHTHESDFWTGAREVKTDFMSMEVVFDYTQSDGVQVLKMPYDGYRLSMLVLLPSERNGLNHLEEIATPEQIDRWKEDLSPTRVDILLPKFEMKTNYDLIRPLRDLGATDVFDRNISDLSGIADLGPSALLYVNVAKQDAYVQVGEEGTEAAAVTAFVEDLVTVSMEPPPAPVPFTADHPFLFLIQDDESGTILFMGRVSDPS